MLKIFRLVRSNSMNFRSKKRKTPTVPISAMSDIGFLLLIFIMLVALINYREEVKLEYPEARQLQRTGLEHNLELAVNLAGEYFVDGKPSNLQNLEFVVADAINAHPDVRIHVVADQNTPYRHVNAIVDLLQLLGHRSVSFLVKEST